MNGTDYTGDSITFDTSGEYTVAYTYTDPYNFDANHAKSDVVYTKYVHINVIAVEPEVVIYHPEFSYKRSEESMKLVRAFINACDRYHR